MTEESQYDGELKVIAYYPLHYGIEYLEASIKSIEPCVDKIVIYYSANPTHGYRSVNECPESMEELYSTAVRASNKVTFIDVTSLNIGAENAHRHLIYEMSDGYDLVLAVDADEVWDTDVLRESLKAAAELPNRYIKVDGFVNFWRSFNHVCYDHFHPVRITNLKALDNVNQGTVKGLVYHFSTAQREEIMRYKYRVFGHASEIRPNWLEDKFFGWEEGMADVHPVAIGLWNPVRFDKDKLPKVLKSHKNYNKEVI